MNILSQEFNINDTAEVDLTDHGLQVVMCWVKSVCTPEVLAVIPNAAEQTMMHHLKSDGIHRMAEFSLWEMMRIFGPHSFNGCKQLFVDNRIKIRRN